MVSVPFHYIEFRAFCYATEDDKRVRTALQTFLPPDHTIEETVTRGHHGDRILVFSTRIETADEIRYVFSEISKLSNYIEVKDDLERRIDDDCSFYLRFDKQRAFRGEVVLGPGIQFRGKIETYPAKREAAIDVVRSYFDECRTLVLTDE